MYNKEQDMSDWIYGSQKYHLRFGFSNKMVCLTYLNRIEPYTNSFLLINNNLDNPNRILFSIKSYWQCVLNDKQCHSELTPEFYYLPEFLKN